MATRSFPSQERCKLYKVKLDKLTENNSYETFIKVLILWEMPTGGMIDGQYLERLITNARHQLFVLLGPTDTWDELGPTVYCVVQVCLEGDVPNMPKLNEEDQVRKAFQWFPQLYPYSLMGVRIVHVCALADAPEEEYQSTSLKHLTRYYNGEMAQEAIDVIPQREGNLLTPLQSTGQGSMHYLGVLTNATIEDYQLWMTRDFTLIFAGQLKAEAVAICVMLKPLRNYDRDISRLHEDCSLDSLYKCTCQIFLKLLGIVLRSFDRFLALRILKRNIELVQQGEPMAAKKPWESELDERRVNHFTQGKCDPELVAHLIMCLAESYFGGVLPVELSDDEESVVLLWGLQKHDLGHVKEKMNFGEDELRSCLIATFGKVFDYFNSITPEVVDG